MNSMRGDTADYGEVLIGGLPLLDVRAPLEFAKGAFPSAVNLPLLDDQERHQVGLRYKQKGQDAAIALGHELVNGAIKAQRLQAWADFARAHPQGYLYCFRGGLRSHTVRDWLREAGVDYPLVRGGYKAMRTYLLGEGERLFQRHPIWVLGGMTGTGKTEVIQRVPWGVDLEGFARHRGSSFGWRAQAQPAPIDFEHSLTLDLLRRERLGQARWLLEDESRTIGRCALPLTLHTRMQQAPLLWLEAPFEERAQRILHQYVSDQCAEHVALLGAQAGFARFAQRLDDSLQQIRRRLGSERCDRLLIRLHEALTRQQNQGDTSGHLGWIEPLLREYYDPMYAYQAAQKGSRIVCRGDAATLLAFLAEAQA